MAIQGRGTRAIPGPSSSSLDSSSTVVTLAGAGAGSCDLSARSIKVINFPNGETTLNADVVAVGSAGVDESVVCEFLQHQNGCDRIFMLRKWECGAVRDGGVHCM
jgi:hypothetical protein